MPCGFRPEDFFHVNWRTLKTQRLLKCKLPLLRWCHYELACIRESRKFCQRGSNADKVFYGWWGERGSKYHFKSVIIDPPGKRFPGLPMMAPTLNAGLLVLWFSRGSGPVLLVNPIVLWFFRGGGVWTPCPPLSSQLFSFNCTTKLADVTASYKFVTASLLFRINSLLPRINSLLLRINSLLLRINSLLLRINFLLLRIN